jgi:hypothetical protein
MNAIRRLLGPAVLFSIVLALVAASAFAQNPCDEAEGIAALDAKIRTNYPKPETFKVALEAGKQYVQKYGECEPKDFALWLKDRLGKWELILKDIDNKAKIKKFDAAVRSKNYDEVYAVGKELVEIFPENVNFMLPLALIGLPETYKKNYKYNDDSIKYAKMALAKLKSGTAESKKKDGKPILDASGKLVFGPFQFERNADEAISELTFGLGYILYHAKKDKRAGLLYLYEASQLPGLYRTEPQLYSTIGQYYREESAPIGKEIVDLMAKQEAAPTVEEKQKLEVEIKSKAALFNGYSERRLDALSRAYRFVDEKIPSEKALKARVYAEIAAALGAEAKERLDNLVAAAAEKPFPDPTSAVTPIDDPEPVKSNSTEATQSPDAKGKPSRKAKSRVTKRRP